MSEWATTQIGFAVALFTTSEVAPEFRSAELKPGKCREGKKDERANQPREVHAGVHARGGAAGEGWASAYGA